MKQKDWNDYKELCDNIYEALSDAYPDDSPAYYEFAVRPSTLEVKVVESESEVEDDWVYECIVDAEWETIEECAKQYFDFRR